MGKLIDFYKQHRRLFLSQKHQNTRQTERFRDMVVITFLAYCESKNVFHTDGIRKKQIAIDFFNSGEMSNKSYESRRKYFLIIREFYRRYKKIELKKEDVKL